MHVPAAPTAPPVDDPQSRATARKLVDAFFSNVYKAYPFLDRANVLALLHTRFCGFDDLQRRSAGGLAGEDTILYLVMAIGCTTVKRAGHVADDDTTVPNFDINYAAVLQRCLMQGDGSKASDEDSLQALQILVLLALYALFDPSGASPWMIVGVVARQAVLQGLTRKEFSDEDNNEKTRELRHRLVWSIFVLDRMVAASLGLPVALTDEGMDVPLPGLTVNEFASPERATHAAVLQTSRHVIKLRQLEDRILKEVHFKRDTTDGHSGLVRAHRKSIVTAIQAEIDNWYSNGCLIVVSPKALSSPAAQTTTEADTDKDDNLPIHSSVTWLSARYYHLLILLHYPGLSLHPNGATKTAARADLLRYVQKHIQSTSVLFQQRQLPLNRVTLCRLFPVALLILYGFIWSSPSSRSFGLHDETVLLVAFLDSFSPDWTHAHAAAAILRQFLGILAATALYEPLYVPLHIATNGGYTLAGGLAARDRDKEARAAVRPQIAALLELMYTVLGRATSFAYQEDEDEDNETQDGPGPVPYEATDNTLFLPRDALVSRDTLVPTDENAVMDLRWAGLELDFL